MILLLLSLFITNPAPLEMPRAEAYLVQEDGVKRLEDRFNRLDLWTSQTVDGRWIDDDGRVFTHATLRSIAPEWAATNGTMTRADYEGMREPLAHKDKKELRKAMDLLTAVELAADPRPPRQLPRGLKDADYYQGTNRSVIVCAYLPEVERNEEGRIDHRLPRIWRLAVWELIDGDDYEEALRKFETEFLSELETALPPGILGQGPSPAGSVSERELLRRDARHSVSAYEGWHVTDSDEFTVLDDLPANRDFIASLTNDLRKMRAEYAKTVPTDIDGSNVLAVARIYSSRDEYLDALEADGLTNMSWTAAYWSPSRREIVAHLSENGGEALLKTLRHEAFHQYLSYATSMISVSPWLNEGYAQYFEGEALPPWSQEEVRKLGEMLPALMLMDYSDFYSGSDEERRLKYRLALSIAQFLEQGAPKVRFEPFKDFKKDYFAALFKSQDMRKATGSAFGNKDRLGLFVEEWVRFIAAHAH